MSNTLTPAEIADACNVHAERFYVYTDTDRAFGVRGVLPDGSLLVKGRFVDSPWMVVRVTSRTWQQRPRVRFFPGRDHGYLDGRVTFDGEAFGGYTWRGVLDTLDVATTV